MKIPKRLKIDGLAVRVTETRTIKKVGKKKGDKYLGLAEITHGRITLATHHDGRELPEGKRAETFMHEILHYIAAQRGINLAEDTVKSLAGGLMAVIRDNDLDFRDKSIRRVK